jgi:hypothetical protein
MGDQELCNLGLAVARRHMEGSGYGRRDRSDIRATTDKILRHVQLDGEGSDVQRGSHVPILRLGISGTDTVINITLSLTAFRDTHSELVR